MVNNLFFHNKAKAFLVLEFSSAFHTLGSVGFLMKKLAMVTLAVSVYVTAGMWHMVACNFMLTAAYLLLWHQFTSMLLNWQV